MPQDDYPTCRRTFATLRIYHKSAAPSMVSRALKLKPSKTQVAGKTWTRRGKTRTYPISGWFLESEAKVDSYDSARHLNWLLDALEKKIPAIRSLKEKGWWMDVSVYWDSESGHGGPTLSPDLLTRLGFLGIELWFDVYFSGAMDYTRMIKHASSTFAKEA